MKRTLNLDPMFAPIQAPEIEFDTFKFSGGETHIRLSDKIDYSKVDNVVMTHRIRSGDDIMLMMLAREALDQLGVKSVDLVLPYIPYGRQDRVCNKGEASSLELISALINGMCFDHVVTIDPHSKATNKSIKKLIELPVWEYVRDAVSEIESEDTINKVILVSPDAGSAERVKKIGEKIGRDVIYCEKTREPKTGKLNGFKINDGVCGSNKYLIVDDICDGGGTFLGLRIEFSKFYCTDVSLYVTHGIFSKGIDLLYESFVNIFTTNSFSDIDYHRQYFRQFKLRI